MRTSQFSIGERVTYGVYVINEFHPMGIGTVVDIHDGFYSVDRMSLYGGAPWITYETHVQKPPTPINK